MADNGSANRLANRRIRQAQAAGRPRIDADTGVRVPAPPNYAPAVGAKAAPSKSKTRNGGGFNPSVSLNKTTIIAAANGAPAAGANGSATGTPGGDFMSNEDIRAFSEHLRKAARKRAVERALDAEMLFGRLRNIPDQFGRMSGSRARARRVTRWLKRIAQAEKLIAKYSAALYSAFEREYDAELMKIGKGRAQQKAAPRFHWR